MTKNMRELLNKKNELKNEIRALLNENKIEEAKEKRNKLLEIEDKIEIEASLSDEGRQVNENQVENKDLVKEAFAKYVKRQPLTEEEKNIIKTNYKNTMTEGSKEDGGALVPFDEDTSIISLRQAEDALQNLITVVKVNTNEGKRTIRTRRSGTTNFKKIAEKGNIDKGTNPQYKELNYSCKKYASIYDITNELISDSSEDVVSELNMWIGHDSRENRNALILGELSKKSEKISVEGYDDIKDILNTKLNISNSRHASIITNQDGYNFLDKIKDGVGNYILQPVVGEPDKYVIKGKKLYVYDNSILPTSEENKIPIIIGDFKMSIVMFDRQEVTVKVTEEGGYAFETDTVLLRAVEREDIQTLDEDAFVYGEITKVD